ncbi:MAG: hypothetical protein LBN93_08645 [Candidatus Symbiothrix sp.]|jgi:hypothetical protein|nr:hypothetical protein [Candidatus Symbiothrix sp.]
MKTLDLNAYGVSAMTHQEMVDIDGGNIFEDAWNWIKGAANTVAKTFTQLVKEYGAEIALAIITAVGVSLTKDILGFE